MDQVLKSKAEKYYDNFIERLITDYVQSNPRAEKAILFSLKWLLKANCKNILDIGCGIGWSTAEFAQNLPGSRIQGLDLSPKLISTAKTLFQKSSFPEFSVTDITSTNFNPLEKYDAVVMLDLYEHIQVADRQLFHAAIKNCIAQSFTIVLTCPSPSFQGFLRSNNPELLQPVDEDVTETDAELFAKDVGGELTYFQPTSIWQSYDYNHIVISKGHSVGSTSDEISLLELEKRDSKIERLARTPLKPILKKLGRTTWLKARFPILISISRLLK